MSNKQSSIGQIVHYVSYGTPGGEHKKACRTAIITQVVDPAGEAGSGIVGLAVLNPGGIFFDQECPHVDAEHMLGGSWHWPEQV